MVDGNTNALFRSRNRDTESISSLIKGFRYLISKPYLLDTKIFSVMKYILFSAERTLSVNTC